MGNHHPAARFLPQDQFWDPGVVKNGFLAKFHAGLTYFHNFSMDFLKIVISVAPGVVKNNPWGPKNENVQKSQAKNYENK